MLSEYIPQGRDIRTVIILFPFFMVLLYLDTIQIAVSPDLFFKLPLILIMLIILVKRSDLVFPAFFVFGVLFAAKQLIFFDTHVKYYATAAGTSALDLLVPVLALYLIKFSSYEKVGKYLFVISSILILSTIPYHLGLLEQSGKDTQDYGLEKYGVEGRAFTGAFISVHGASITLSIALVCLLFNFYKTKDKIVKIWILGLGTLALLTIYMTYVRTAMVMLFVGFIIYTFWGKSSKKVFVGLVTFAILAFVASLIYENSAVLQLRFSDTNVYGADVAAGSGRADFWRIMLTYSVSNGIGPFLIGTGREAGMDYMYIQMGQRLFSHNGFIDILVSTGFLGLCTFLAYQRLLFQRLWRKRNRILPSYKLLLIIFLMYWTAILFQAHEFFWVFIMIALVIAQVEKEYKYSTTYVEPVEEEKPVLTN